MGCGGMICLPRGGLVVVSRAGWWITGGLAVALAAALPLVPRAAPQRLLSVGLSPVAGQSFAATCKDDVVADSRPDPAWTLASYEGDDCRAPAMPVAPNGRFATRIQITAGMASVTAYAWLSRTFEKCVSGFVASRRARGTAPAGKSFLLVETHRILASEKNRRQAASRMAAAIIAFNAYGSDCAD